MSRPFLNWMWISKITKNNIITTLVPLLRDNPSSRRPTWLALRLTVPTKKTTNVTQYDEKIKKTYNYIFLAIWFNLLPVYPFPKDTYGSKQRQGRCGGRIIIIISIQKIHVPVSQSSSRYGSTADVTAIWDQV